MIFDAAVVSPGFRGMPQHARGRILYDAVLRELWDEQSRVGGLFAYTPEEWAALNAPPADGGAG